MICWFIWVTTLVDSDRVTAPLKVLKNPLTFAFLLMFTLHQISNDASDPHGSLMFLISIQCTFRIYMLTFNWAFSVFTATWEWLGIWYSYSIEAIVLIVLLTIHDLFFNRMCKILVRPFPYQLKNPNSNQMVSHVLSPLQLRFKGLYFGSYQNLA